jgi:peptidoglycan/xylan/chitin deacetylase (PgdA/CDA1 family)
VPGPRQLQNETFVLHGATPLRRPGGEVVLPVADVVQRVDGDGEALGRAAAGLPPGPAGAEATAVRLRQLGASLEWGASEPVAAEELAARFRAWGAGAVDVVRTDASLLPELAIGAWLDGSRRHRAVRRVAMGLGGVPAAHSARLRRLALEIAFWRGVAAEATTEEWRLITGGYTVLLYHRLAGELKPGQERIDVPPTRFAAQMRLVRRLGFATLSAEELVCVHAAARPPPKRAVAVTFDDAFAEIVEPLLRHAGSHPLVFVPTADAGRAAAWLDGERVATWDALAGLARAGVGLGGHTRSHVDLTVAGDAQAEAEIRGPREDLFERTGVEPIAFAYPHGRFGSRERELVRAAGYSLAFGTQPGRNGVGSDPFALRRVSVKAWDSGLSFAWKLVTGEQPPAPWERWLLLRAAAARRLARVFPLARTRARAAARRRAEPPRRQGPSSSS